MTTPMYVFKFTPEFWWALIEAIVGGLSAGVITQGALPPNDWRAWAIGVVAGLVRVVGGLVLSNLHTDKPA